MELKRMTQECEQELAALQEFNDHMKRPSALLRRHWNESGYRLFAARRYVNWGPPPEPFSKDFRGAEITQKGRDYLKKHGVVLSNDLEPLEPE